MFNHRDHDDFDFDDPWFKDAKRAQDEWAANTFKMGLSIVAYVIAGVVVLAILIACCCRKRRAGGQIISPPPPAPPAPGQPAPYPQQQYAPYPTQPPPVTVYPVTSAYPAPAAPYADPGHPGYPHPGPGNPGYPAHPGYPTVTPYPPAAPAQHVFYGVMPPQLPAGWAVPALPPSYEQVMGAAAAPLEHGKQPPYNPSAPPH